MPEMKEIFDMVTKRTEPDLSSWNEQEQRQRRMVRDRKVGAIALVVALLALAAIVAITLPGEDRTEKVGNQPPPPSGPYVLNISTVTLTPLPDTLPEGGLLAVSPNGTMIAGAPCCSPPNPVWVANIDGSDLRNITPEGIDGFAPRWSPDGSMLVYQERDASTDEIGELVVVDMATDAHTTITDLPDKSYGGWSLLPSFTADGRSVLFRMPRGPSGDLDPVRHDLVSVPVAGGATTVLRRGASLGASSPIDGSIVFVDPATWTLFLADADGQNAQTLLVVGDEVNRVAWSPLGSDVAYSDPSGVHILQVANGDVFPVAGGEDAVDWSW